MDLLVGKLTSEQTEPSVKTEDGDTASQDRENSGTKSLKLILQISRLERELDVLTVQNESMNAKYREKAIQVHEMDNKLMDQKRQLKEFWDHSSVGTGMNKDTRSGGIRNAHPKLERLHKRINLANYQNKNLEQEVVQAKDEINILRKQQMDLKKLCETLATGLETKEQSLTNILIEAEKAHNEKLEADVRYNEVKEIKTQRQNQFERKLRGIKEEIERDGRVQMLLSPTKRKTNDNQSMLRNGKAMVIQDLSTENRLKSKVLKGVWSMAKEKAVQHASKMKIHSYEDAFQNITSNSEISNFREACNKLVKMEFQNQECRDLVVNKNKTREKIYSSIFKLKQELQKYNHMGVETENKQESLITDLERKSNSLVHREKSLIQLLTENKAEHAEILQEVKSMYATLGCENMKVAEIIKEQENKHLEVDCMLYLGVIEQRTNDLLQIHAQSCSKLDEQGPSQARCVALNSQRLRKMVPTVDHVASNDDKLAEEVEDKPLLGMELRD